MAGGGAWRGATGPAISLRIVLNPSSNESRLSPSDLIAGAPRAAIAFLPLAWRRAWLSMLLAVLAMALVATVRGGPFAECWTAVAALAVVVEWGALWRLALGREPLRFGGLQMGRVEVRLVAAAALSIVFMMILGLLAFIVVLAFAYAAAASGHGFVASDVATWAGAVDDRGRVVVVAVAVACALLLLWAFGRISLAAPASVRRGQVQVLSTWPLTRGQVWSMTLAGLLVMAVPTILIAALARAGTVAAPGLAGVALVAAAIVAGGVWLPLNVGLVTYLYSRLDSAGGAPPV
jgi:hypothetical protein